MPSLQPASETTETLAPLSEGSETLATLSELVATGLFPSEGTFPGTTTFPEDDNGGLHLSPLSED